jgi:hypothetical protein
VIAIVMMIGMAMVIVVAINSDDDCDRVVDGDCDGHGV